MNNDDRLNELAKVAAYRVIQAFELFKDEPEAVRRHAPNVIMTRVQSMINGHSEILDDYNGSIVTVLEPDEESPINTGETPSGESPEAV